MSNSNEEKKAKATWGRTEAQFYHALRGQQVKVTFLDGKVIKGRLVGVDRYNFVLGMANGGEVMVFKHSLKYVHVVTEDE